VTINVARSEDEAERQARGEDVLVLRDEGIELETFDPEAEMGEGGGEGGEMQELPDAEQN
jgi:large subunit ribosomal protein L9